MSFRSYLHRCFGKVFKLRHVRTSSPVAWATSKSLSKDKQLFPPKDPMTGGVIIRVWPLPTGARCEPSEVDVIFWHTKFQNTRRFHDFFRYCRETKALNHFGIKNKQNLKHLEQVTPPGGVDHKKVEKVADLIGVGHTTAKLFEQVEDEGRCSSGGGQGARQREDFGRAGLLFLKKPICSVTRYDRKPESNIFQ